MISYYDTISHDQMGPNVKSILGKEISYLWGMIIFYFESFLNYKISKFSLFLDTLFGGLMQQMT